MFHSIKKYLFYLREARERFVIDSLNTRIGKLERDFELGKELDKKELEKIKKKLNPIVKKGKAWLEETKPLWDEILRQN